METEFILEYDVLSMSREHHLYLLARIKSGTTPATQHRRPLNLSVVLDRSGSMAGPKLERVKEATMFLIQHLTAEDRFSLVTYDQRVTVNISPRAAVQKDRIKQLIEAIKSGGQTNLSGGWLQGAQLVQEGSAEGQSNRVLLLTDGQANEGVTDPKRLAMMAKQKRDEGVTTTTIGVGMDFNEDLLTQMAVEGGGAFYFIDNPDQTPAIFEAELEGLSSVVGQNMMITVTRLPPVHTVSQLNAYPTETHDTVTVFRLGDLYTDETKILLLKLHIPALESLGTLEVARLRFDFDELGAEQIAHRTTEFPITINAVPEDEANKQQPNQEVVTTALLLGASQARTEAIRQADQGKYKEAKQTLDEAAENIQQSGLDDPNLQTEHDMLREEAVDMELGDQRYNAYTRKASTTKAYTGSLTAAPTFGTAELHSRLKSSREAIERSGELPTLLTWKSESLMLTMDLLKLGRADDNDIVIDDEAVSRYHCQIVRNQGTLFLEDLNAANGTFANGGRVTGRFRLSAGDVMTVGSLLFRFK